MEQLQLQVEAQLYILSKLSKPSRNDRNFRNWGPPQTRDLVVDNYLWSTTKSYRQVENVVCGASCRQLNPKLLVVDN